MVPPAPLPRPAETKATMRCFMKSSDVCYHQADGDFMTSNKVPCLACLDVSGRAWACLAVSILKSNKGLLLS